MAKNIVLVGFMGVGKGQVARELAVRTSFYTVDCDDLIESTMNMKVKKIFANYGEKKFRDLERQTAKWLEKNVKKTIISTGGGFINVPNLKKIGTIVYLHAEYEFIIDRIMSHPNAAKKVKKRPLLQDLPSAKKLYLSRLPMYRKVSDHIVDVTGKDAVSVADDICKALHLL
jgi:shikimate kinase